MSTCEGCNRSSEEIIVAVLCQECSDKAARFDIVLIEHKQLLQAVESSITDLKCAGETKSKGLRLIFLSQALGRLMVVESYCKS